MKHAIVNKIFETLTRRKFEQWYGKGGRFDNWIEGNDGAPTEEEINSIPKEKYRKMIK